MRIIKGTLWKLTMRLIIFLLCLGLATAVALFYLDTTDEDVHRAIERYSKEVREQTKRNGKDSGQSVGEINERLQKLREEFERMRLKANEALGERKEELTGKAEALREKARKLGERAAELGEKARSRVREEAQQLHEQIKAFKEEIERELRDAE